MKLEAAPLNSITYHCCRRAEKSKLYFALRAQSIADVVVTAAAPPPLQNQLKYSVKQTWVPSERRESRLYNGRNIST
jgi:hypothetical protein